MSKNKDESTVAMPDLQEFSDVLKVRIKEYSFATFERAFNDDRDGLKPVARRTLYSMKELNLTNMFKKVQYVSGVVMKYHPYNSDTIADAITQLGQWFVKNYPYLETQGNFGSLKYIKGYAAPRYIECKLNKFAQDCITDDIDDHCIPYKWNYDNTFMEPEYLPTKVPLTLIQGGVGLGEGYINGIPPYNLGDVVDCCIKVIKNKNISLKELMNGIYPDFPTGGEIINKSELDEFQTLSAYKVESLNRQGKNFNIRYRAKLNINRDKNIIEILELPFRVDFDSVWDRILYEVNEKQNVILKGIINKSDRLDTKRNGNIIFELICSKDANMLEIVDQLFIKTPLETSFSLSYMLFCGKYLNRMDFKDIILRWYETQYDVIRRKFNFLLSDNQNRIHILEGLVLVYDKMDSVINTIKSSQDKESCINNLVSKFGLSMVQAKGISEMQLSSLTRASKPALLEEIRKLKQKIEEIENKLENIDLEIINNLTFMKNKYARPRRTTVIDLKEERDSKTCINISNGSVLYSRDSVGIFDSTALLNGKNIINSLKPVRIDKKNVKEIMGYHSVNNNIAGIIIFSSDGTARRTKLSEVPITNNWVVTNDQNFPITCAVPVYDGIDSDIVTINSDYKIKVFKASEINNKKVQTGIIFAAQLVDYNKLDNVLIYNEFGEYIYIDKNEIPLLSRNSAGNITSFGRGEKFNIIPIYNSGDGSSLLITFVEGDDGNTSFTAIDEINLEISHRTNKPKQLLKLKHSKFIGIGLVNAKTKNSSDLMLISPYNSIRIKGRFVKDKMDMKRISNKPFGLIQIPEVD